jgi:hypothetical protein
MIVTNKCSNIDRNAIYGEWTGCCGGQILPLTPTKEKRRKMATKEELKVFPLACGLCEYLYIVGKNIPKEYRWNVGSEINKCGANILRLLYDANTTPVGGQRKQKQILVDIELRMLGKFLTIAGNLNLVSAKQTKTFATKILNTRKALYAWINGSEK